MTSYDMQCLEIWRTYVHVRVCVKRKLLNVHSVKLASWKSESAKCNSKYL